jgi:AcrR family transcriptional regulator
MSDTIREPVQKRSIDKKNRIIQAGYDLFAKNGYFNTNTVQIAKKAGVSTGIVYGYFHDKRDILIEVLQIYIDDVFQPVISKFESICAPLDFDLLITHSIDSTVEIHRNNAAIHEALHSMSYTDEVVRNRFLELEKEMTKKIVEALKRSGYDKPDLYERVHFAFETIQSYAHECVYDKHDYIDYSIMRDIVLKMIKDLFI